MTPDIFALVGLTLAVALASFFLSPKAVDAGGFYEGRNAQGAAPGLWTLVLSQVTTWIFARSLLTAAVLGFYYGAPGALAYACYYLSFLTGGLIIDRLRFGAGFGSIQGFLSERFGVSGPFCYNIVVGLRLVSEVFANLLVVGTIFTGAFGADLMGGIFGEGIGDAGAVAIIGLALLALAYSMLGGLRASLRTDVFQMLIFLAVFAVAMVALVTHESFSIAQALSAQGVSGAMPGWVLVAVALLQVISYPMHDPVMMDRGFLASRRTTAWSFIHAFWISAACIFGFGLLGVQAGLLAGDGEGMQAVWGRMFDPWVLLAINLALIVSAVSTLDSTLSSSAKLVVVDMQALPRSLLSGRIVMVLFMLAGLGFCFLGSKDLFAAVAVSGTASMFLAPVILFSILGGARHIPIWSYLVAFAAAMAGAVLYFLISGKKALGLQALAVIGVEHKYSALLVICVAVLVIGCSAFALGVLSKRSVANATT